ncbi:MAG: hypothetical protein ABIZ70_00570 [Gemmatimonadales bacterium]
MRLPRALLLTAALLIGCAGSEPTTPPSVVIRLERGDDQAGEVGTLLDPIVVVLIGADGAPLPGVAVRVKTPAGGSVTLDAPRSAPDGSVTMRWRLADLLGDQALEISADGARTLVLKAHALNAPPERLPLDRVLLIGLPTYEGSGQAVHPDVAVDPLWSQRLLMAFTPYPGGDSRYENPSMVTTITPRSWTVPHGLSNPVAQINDGYLSDPDLVAPQGDRWSLYYRAVVDGTNRILLTQSDDAVQWGAPVEVLRAPNHAVVSPAVVRGGASASWKMWSVNSGPAGCRAAQTTTELRESNDGRRWSAALTTDLSWPGRVVWHLDVIWVAARQEYWALAATYAAGSTCVTDQLQFARSNDGVRWTRHPVPILTAGVLPEFSDVIYRSSMQLEPEQGTVVFWLSGAGFNGSIYSWHTGALRVSMATLLNASGPLAPAFFAGVIADRSLLPPPERDY